jgi:hypothetical protein
LVRNLERKTPFRRPRRRRKKNVKMNLKEMDVDSIQLAQVRVQWRAFVNRLMKLRFPYNIKLDDVNDYYYYYYDNNNNPMAQIYLRI